MAIPAIEPARLLRVSNSTSAPFTIVGQGEESSMLDSSADISFPIICAVLFFKFMLFACWRIVRKRTWYFSMFTTALLLETAGLCTQAYLDKHETSHEADVLSFALLTLSPILVILTTFVTFGRLMQWTQHSRSFLTILLRPTLLAPVFICVEIIPAALLVSGTISYARFHSSQPILTHEDALARLTALDTANGLLAAGYAFQTVLLSVFTFVAVAIMAVTPNWGAVLDKDEDKMKNRWRRFALSLSFVGFCLGGRTVYKLITFGGLASDNLALVESDAEFCFFDMLPLLLVCLTFSFFFPGVHLPKRLTGFWAKSCATKSRSRSIDIEGEPEAKPPAYAEKGVAV